MLIPNSTKSDNPELTYDSLSSIREENDKDIEAQKETCSDFITKTATQNQDIVCCCGSFICTFACIAVPTFVLLYYFG